MISKKTLLEKMNGKTVTVNYIGMKTVADNEALKKSIIDSLEENGKTIDDFYEDDSSYRVKGFNQFWWKSKLIPGEKGLFVVRTKDYYFVRERDGQKVYGDIPKANDMEILPNENGFKKKASCENQWIVYEIAQEEAA